MFWIASGLGLFAISLAPEHYGLGPVLRSMFRLHAAGPGPIGPAVRVAIAVSGALTVALGLVLWYVRPSAASTPDSVRQIGRAVTIGFAVWFVLDSAASFALGGAGNVLTNTLALAAVLPPALACARSRA